MNEKVSMMKILSVLLAITMVLGAVLVVGTTTLGVEAAGSPYTYTHFFYKIGDDNLVRIGYPGSDAEKKWVRSEDDGSYSYSIPVDADTLFPLYVDLYYPDGSTNSGASQASEFTTVNTTIEILEPNTYYDTSTPSNGHTLSATPKTPREDGYTAPVLSQVGMEIEYFGTRRSVWAELVDGLNSRGTPGYNGEPDNDANAQQGNLLAQAAPPNYNLFPYDSYKLKLDLSDFILEGLTDVDLSFLINALNVENGVVLDKVMWNRDENGRTVDDFNIAEDGATIDISNTDDLILLVGLADQLDQNRTRYVVDIIPPTSGGGMALARNLSSTDFNVTGLTINGNADAPVYEISPDDDSYVKYKNYQALLTSRTNEIAEEDAKAIPYFTVASGDEVKIGDATQTKGVSVVDFADNPVKYTVAGTDYFVSVVKANLDDPELYVHGPENREVVFGDGGDNYHDIFFANIGKRTLTGITAELIETDEVKLRGVKLDDYWQVGNANSLAGFTKDEIGSDPTELWNVGKIRLVPDGAGAVSGVLKVSANGQEEPVYIYINAHNLTVTAGANGSVTNVSGLYSGGNTVTLTAEPVNDDYAFDHWESNNGGTFANDKSANTTFEMPYGDVEVKAHFVRVYALTVTESDYGTVTPSSGSYPAGTTVSLGASSTSLGYSFSDWSSDDYPYIDGSTDNPLEFLMPAHDVTVTASFSEIPAAPEPPSDPPSEPTIPEEPAPTPPITFTTSGDSVVYEQPEFSTWWLDKVMAKYYAGLAEKRGDDHIRTRHTGSAGVRGSAFSAMGDLSYWHDTTKDGKILARLYLEDPSLFSKDLLTSIITTGRDVERLRTRFAQWYSNQMQFVRFEQQGQFAATVHAAVKLDLTKLNTETLVFYAYDKNANTITQIKNANYAIDANGFLHFYSDFAGDIVITDKPLEKIN